MPLRSERVQHEYDEARANNALVPLNEEPIVPGSPALNYWKVIENRFPHDLHHDTNHMVVLNRNCAFEDLYIAEIMELFEVVIPWAEKHYDYVKINLPKVRTIEDTPHVHLMKLKEKYL